MTAVISIPELSFYICTVIAVLLFIGSFIVLFALVIPAGKKEKEQARLAAAANGQVPYQAMSMAASPDTTAPLPPIPQIRFEIVKKEIYSDAQEVID